MKKRFRPHIGDGFLTRKRASITADRIGFRPLIGEMFLNWIAMGQKTCWSNVSGPILGMCFLTNLYEAYENDYVGFPIPSLSGMCFLTVTAES